MRTVFSAHAKSELRAIALYIAQHNKLRAQSFVRELRQEAEKLFGNPLAFPLVPLWHITVFAAKSSAII